MTATGHLSHTPHDCRRRFRPCRNRVASWPFTVVMRTFSLALVIVAVLASACTSSAQSASVSPKSSPPASPTAAAPTQMCFTDPPADWALAMSHVIATLGGVNFSVGAVDQQHGMAYGGAWMSSRQVIASVDLTTGRMAEIAPMSPNGFGWMTYGSDWLVWPETGIGGSSMQLWNSRTHERQQIVTSGPAGTAVAANGHVIWTEALSGTADVLRVYELATGKTGTLDSGLMLQPPVFAGKYLVWAKQVSSADNPSFVFADPVTLLRAQPPAELRASRDISNLAGSADYLVWTAGPASSPDSGTWFVDDLAVGNIRSYRAHNHYFQFPQLAGPFLVWFGADKTSIVDLRSAIGIDIPLPGGAQAAGDTIVVDRLSTLKGNSNRTEVSVLHPSQLSPLQTC